MTLRLLILLFLAPALHAEIPYRLLRADFAKEGAREKEVAFAVSVDRAMDRTEVEGLVCRILNSEKPPKYQILNIRVFVNLDEYIPDDESSQLAWYVWNRTLPRVRGRLVMMKTMDGGTLDPWQSREFNHEKVCSRLGPAGRGVFAQKPGLESNIAK